MKSKNHVMEMNARQLASCAHPRSKPRSKRRKCAHCYIEIPHTMVKHEAMEMINNLVCPGMTKTQDVQPMSPSLTGGRVWLPPSRSSEVKAVAHVRAGSPPEVGGSARLVPLLPPAGWMTGENLHEADTSMDDSLIEVKGDATCTWSQTGGHLR